MQSWPTKCWHYGVGTPARSLKQLHTVEVPTLIMVADDDMQSVAQCVAMQNALPSAQLAAVPGTSHALTNYRFTEGEPFQ